MAETDAAIGGSVLVGRAPIVRLGVALLVRAGAPEAAARTVMDHLADASAMGLHSHGLIRIPQYLRDITTGEIDPNGPLLSAESIGATLLQLADIDPGEFILGVDPIEGVLS